MKLLLFFLSLLSITVEAQQKRPRELGIKTGVMKPGINNAITDVAGVKIGHTTLADGEKIHTGVTAVVPHEGNLFQDKVPAAIFVANGFGKLTGISQVQELGNIETPIVLTNTLSVPTAADAVIDYTLAQKGNEKVRSVNPVIGETNDSYLNDITGRHITKEHVLKAIETATTGKVQEGNVGAGTGTVCFGWKGGIGTASRVLPAKSGGYTVGVIVQTNFGGVLQINGVPVGEELNQYFLNDQLNDPADGSCMIVVATDAPITARNLERLAKRAIFGLAKTGGIASNGSGDYVIAFSTAKPLRVAHNGSTRFYEATELRNDDVSPLFLAAIEATEEAIINAMFAAQTTKGANGTIKALPTDKVLELSRKYNKLK
ncbi:DmpA family aminopeptidase [Emticicia fluvialis]|uniref:DmpA family aminopeptidase n=1 Tax=Emticicia fluvialis TaxID=2974474 RepID=UPI0021655346|nr:P1 family peptidase [Emticicia fluvialis]